MSEVTRRLQEIRERADKATLGPWDAWQGDNDAYLGVLDAPPDKLWNVDATDAGKWVARKVWNAEDAEFIAFARDDIVWLLDLVAKLQEAVR